MVTTGTHTDTLELQALREARATLLGVHRPVVLHPGYIGVHPDAFTWTQTLSAYVAHPNLGPTVCEECDEITYERPTTFEIDPDTGEVLVEKGQPVLRITNPYPCPYADLLLNTLPSDTKDVTP